MTNITDTNWSGGALPLDRSEATPFRGEVGTSSGYTRCSGPALNICAVHFAAFAREASRRRAVFSFTEDGEFLVFRAEGHEVVPLWSSESRLGTIRRRDPRFEVCRAVSISLEDLGEWLRQIEERGARVGVNWVGENLTGYDVAPPEILVMLGLDEPASESGTGD